MNGEITPHNAHDELIAGDAMRFNGRWAPSHAPQSLPMLPHAHEKLITHRQLRYFGRLEEARGQGERSCKRSLSV